MNTSDTSKLTGIPAGVLKALRSRNETVTNRSGPPYSKVIDKNGVSHFRYNKTLVLRWMAKTNLLLTAKEAANLIGVTRTEIMAVTGTKRFDFRRYSIVISPAKNLFIMILKGRKKVA
jgi:hypothetical protein